MDTEPNRPPEIHWLRGALISAFGLLIGAVSLALFCYALGLNFRDEGWSSGHDPWKTHRGSLIGSLVGFAIAILLFWLGFFRAAHSKSERL